MFLAAGVDDVTAQAAAGDKGRVAGDVTGALQEFTGRQRGSNEVVPHERKLVLRERCAGLEIRAKDVK